MTKNNPAIGLSWEEARQQLEEIAESNLRVALIGEFIKVRQEKGISQKQLEEMTGIKQPVIARMEKGTSCPRIDTLLKALGALGKTLAIVPLTPRSPDPVYSKENIDFLLKSYKDVISGKRVKKTIDELEKLAQ